MDSTNLVSHQVASANERLVVEYAQLGDRFCQRILWDQAELARSLDGTPDESWPASPPIQDISLESIEGHPTILGVGAAGQGHWSISVGKSPNLEHGIRFDIACRLKTVSGFLGSTYQLTEGSQVSPTVLVELGRLEKNGGNWRIEPQIDEQSMTHRWLYDIGVEA